MIRTLFSLIILSYFFLRFISKGAHVPNRKSSSQFGCMLPYTSTLSSYHIRAGAINFLFSCSYYIYRKIPPKKELPLRRKTLPPLPQLLKNQLQRVLFLISVNQYSNQSRSGEHNQRSPQSQITVISGFRTLCISRFL